MSDDADRFRIVITRTEYDRIWKHHPEEYEDWQALIALGVVELQRVPEGPMQTCERQDPTDPTTLGGWLAAMYAMVNGGGGED